jgi:hypothetical protein
MPTRRSGITPHGPKVREAVLHVIRQADAGKFRVTQFDILKTIFIADRAHLNRYGRPITFDDYAAMLDGPVPSLAYDVLKEGRAALAEAQITARLWTVAKAGEKKNHYFGAVREASDEVLSESDFEELNRALALVHQLGYKGTWDLVHDDLAYKVAWAKKPVWSKQADMDYALLFESEDTERAEELKFISAHK